MIISGHAYVSPEGQAGSRQLAVLDDGYIGPLAEMASAVHGAGGHDHPAACPFRVQGPLGADGKACHRPVRTFRQETSVLP